MALKIIQGGVEPLRTINVACSHPITPASGQPVRIGNYVGTALVNETTDGKTTVLIDRHIAKYTVQGVDHIGNSAVALFDPLYYTDGDAPKVNKKNTGKLLGIALGTVNSAAEAEIEVLVFGL